MAPILTTRKYYFFANHSICAVFSRYPIIATIDPRESDGTIYQNSNWIEIGKTSGRGYNNRTGKADVGSKLLFIYPLVPDLRKSLELKEPEDKSKQ